LEEEKRNEKIKGRRRREKEEDEQNYSVY